MGLSVTHSNSSGIFFLFRLGKGCSTLAFGSKSKNLVGRSLNLLPDKPIIQVIMGNMPEIG